MAILWRIGGASELSDWGGQFKSKVRPIKCGRHLLAEGWKCWKIREKSDRFRERVRYFWKNLHFGGKKL